MTVMQNAAQKAAKRLLRDFSEEHRLMLGLLRQHLAAAWRRRRSEEEIAAAARRAQADECQWVEQWEWRYTRDFVVPEDFVHEWAVLRFEGLDTSR